MRNKKLIFILLIILFSSLSLSHQFSRREISLRISPLSINFPPANPDLVPLIPAESQIIVEMFISGNEGRSWQLTVLADGDLRAHKGEKIPIENISWTGSPSPPFVNGSLNKRKPQLVASGQGNINLNGQLNFFLRNSWNYRAGEYSQTVIFTLSSL